MSDEVIRAAQLRPLWRLIGELGAARSSAESAQLVADALVAVGGYSGAAVNVTAPDGSIQPVAVAGWPIAGAHAARRTVEPRSARTARGGVRLGRRRRPDVRLIPQSGSVLEQTGSYDLRDGSGELVGMLVVAGREGTSSPSPLQRDLLQALIAQAGIAIEGARRVRHDRLEHERLLESERTMRVAFEEAPLGTALVSLGPKELGRFVRVNDALCRLTQYSAHQLTAMSAQELVHPDERERVEGNLRRAVDGRRTPFRAQRRLVRATGDYIWVQVTISPVVDEDGVAHQAVSHLEALRARDAPEWEQHARHDPRTGLLNSSALREEVAEAMARVQRHETTGAVLLCDLGALATFPDQQTRDRAMAALAERLGHVLRDGDILGHLDENHLLVGIEEIDEADTAALADRIIEALTYSEPGDENSGQVAVEVRASIGIAPFSMHSRDVDAILEQAHVASRRARARGPGTHVLWDRDREDTPPPTGTKQTLYRRTDRPH